MDIWLIVYIVLCVVIGGFFASTFFNNEMKIAGILSLVLLISIFTFYGLRWFEGGNLKGTTQRVSSWPPIVNVCPDFMVSVKDGSKTYCYDAKNIYGLKQSTGVPGISTVTVGGVTGQTGFVVKDDSSSNPNAISLVEDSGTNKKWPFLNFLKTSGDSLFRDPSARMIRWEGVFDGSSLNLGNAPLA